MMESVSGSTLLIGALYRHHLLIVTSQGQQNALLKSRLIHGQQRCCAWIVL